MAFEFLCSTYAAALPDFAGDVKEVIRGALARARAKHADFERFAPAIEFLSTRIFTDHTTIPLDDYLETLYCATKHGDFSRTWRAQLKRPESSAVQ